MTLTPGSSDILARLSDDKSKLFVFPRTQQAFVLHPGHEGVNVNFSDALRLLDHGDVMQVSPHSFVRRVGLLEEVK